MTVVAPVRKGLSRRGALRMIVGTGDRARTHYNCDIVDKARENGVNLIVMRNGKEVVASPRRVHRDLTGVYGEHHPRADEGKYIDVDAYTDETYRHIVGAQFVNPFLADSDRYRCNRTIVEAFQRSAGATTMAALKADVKQSKELCGHLIWIGNRDFDGGVAYSPWLTLISLWNLARKVNPQLEDFLRKSRSPQKGAKRHLSAKEKFLQNIEVLQRATVVIDATTGTRRFVGGTTPYALPLMQSGMSIDARYLTTGVNTDGDEVGEYHFRMVWGRSEPRPLLKRLWAYEDQDSRYAYRSVDIQNRCHRRTTAA